MHNYVAGIDQDPIALAHTLDPDAGTARFLHVLDQVVGNSAT